MLVEGDRELEKSLLGMPKKLFSFLIKAEALLVRSLDLFEL